MKPRRRPTEPGAKAKQKAPAINLDSLVKTARRALDKISSYAMVMEALASSRADESAKALFLKAAQDADDALGMALRDTTMGRFRALQSRSSELLCWAISETLAGCQELPQLLKHYEAICSGRFFQHALIVERRSTCHPVNFTALFSGPSSTTTTPRPKAIRTVSAIPAA